MKIIWNREKIRKSLTESKSYEKREEETCNLWKFCQIYNGNKTKRPLEWVKVGGGGGGGGGCVVLQFLVLRRDCRLS